MIQKQEEKAANKKTKKLIVVAAPSVPEPTSVQEPKIPPEPAQPATCERLNEKLADLMNQLSNILSKLGDNIKARAYAKAEETILSVTTDICSPEELNGKPGIGKTIMDKMKEYLERGTLDIIERERNKPENVLSDVYGIGPQKAKDLVEKHGITSIAELREKQDQVLNNVQKMGLRHYEDILKKIPRAEIDQYNSIFAKEFQTTVASQDPDAKYQIVGSYRRGKQESGDIDVIFTSNRPELFNAFLDVLIRKALIIEVLSRGKSKCLVITRLSPNTPARRVDFLYTNHKEFPFSILYFTGSKGFNTVMRGHALKMGLSMNEHGFYKMVDKKKEEPIDEVFADEKTIFDYLGLVYKSPEERIDGRAVI
jgi:DNA polymerase IV